MMQRIKEWMCVQPIDWINRALFLLLLILTIPLLILLIEPLFYGGWKIEISSEAVKGMIDYWDDYSSLITLFGASMTLYIASIQFKKHLDVEAVSALSDLRSKLHSEEKKIIHNFLLPLDDNIVVLKQIDKTDDNKIALSNVELFDYLGTIELGAIMLNRGIITIDEFYNQFGYRVENIVRNADVMNHILSNREYYVAFLDIIVELNKYKTDNGL